MVGLSELARRSGVPKSPAHRILQQLAGGRVHPPAKGYYESGSRFLHVARLSIRHQVDDLRRWLLPCLDLYTACARPYTSWYSIVVVSGYWSGCTAADKWYTPELNVELPISDVFDGLARISASARSIQMALATVREARGHFGPSPPDTEPELFSPAIEVLTEHFGSPEDQRG